MFTDVATVLGGLVLLLAGANGLVRGASSLAVRLGMSPLTIGLTVVAFGTSSPELIVNLYAVRAGQTDVALGNIVGSNIVNVLLILGIAALIRPLSVSLRVVRVDVPLMIAAAIALFFLSLDGRIGRGDGLVLFAGAISYTLWNFFGVGADEEPPARPERIGALTGAFYVVGSLLLLWLGSSWFVSGAAGLAASWGLSELVIALTIVAFGTSLPELSTSVVASIRGERDIAVGNIVGSNVFNVLAILGISASLAPSGIAVAPTVLSFDLPILIAVSVACLPVFFTGLEISRWEGLVFVGYYVAYVSFIVLESRAAELADHFASVMLYFALPLTAMTAVIVAARARRRPRAD